jgi:hypothetical protein
MKERLLTSPEDVPIFLVKSVSGFADSPEYERLDETSRSIAGLVTGQLGIMLVRLQSEALRRTPTAEADATLRDSYRAIDYLASSPSPEVQNLVVVEVLEQIDGPKEVRDAIVDQFGSATRQLYRRWVKPQLSLSDDRDLEDGPPD